jgi:hypothetical protein
MDIPSKSSKKWRRSYKKSGGLKLVRIPVGIRDRLSGEGVLDWIKEALARDSRVPGSAAEMFKDIVLCTSQDVVLLSERSK